MIRKALAVAAMSVAAVAWAQSVGTVSAVTGQVTVSTGSTVTAAVAGAPILDGSFFVTGAAGSLTVTTSTGCVVALQPNQSLTVTSSLTCEQLLASIKPVTGFAGAGGGSIPGTVLASGVFGKTVYELFKSISND